MGFVMLEGVDNSLQRLAHDYAVGFVTGLERLGGIELFDSDFDVAELAIDGRQLGAEIDDEDVHYVASMLTAEIFGGLHHAASEAASLLGGIDREHAEVSARRLPFCTRTNLDVH